MSQTTVVSEGSTELTVEMTAPHASLTAGNSSTEFGVATGLTVEQSTNLMNETLGITPAYTLSEQSATGTASSKTPVMEHMPPAEANSAESYTFIASSESPNQLSNETIPISTTNENTPSIT